MEPVEKEARERFARRGIANRLERVFSAMDLDGDGKIDQVELARFMRQLGHSPSREEVERMVWEVDEDHDGKVGRREFERAFERCANDATGAEPRQLFNVVVFALHAAEADGVQRLMPHEEAAKLMYLQHGRDGMDAEILATFGERGRQDGLTLGDFMAAMTARQVAQRQRGHKCVAPRSPRAPTHVKSN